MLNISNTDARNREFDLSKFWAFRLINIISIISIFLLLSVLLVPIPYFHKARKPCIIDLNLNSNGHSHAVKITHKKLPQNLLSVSFSTHNSDHIIGTVTFGDVSIVRDGDYLGRFINGHYQERRKGLPFRLLIVDVYPDHIVFRRFLLEQHKSAFTQIDNAVYRLPSSNKSSELLDVTMNELLNMSLKNVYKTQYYDMDHKLITLYQGFNSKVIGNVSLGKTVVPFGSNSTFRTLTTVHIQSSGVLKIIITTFTRDSYKPTNLEFYAFASDLNVFYKSASDLSIQTGLKVSEEMFKINRFENTRKTPVEFYKLQTKESRLLHFELKHHSYGYDIICADQSDTIVKVDLKQNSNEFELEQDLLDRVIVMEYNIKEPRPPNYYIFERSMYYTRTKVVKYKS